MNIKTNKTDSFILKNTHEVIISRKLFDKCQKLKFKRFKINKVDDSKRLKGFFFHNNDPLRYQISNNNIKYEYYVNPDIKFSARLDILHEATYQYCIDMIMKLSDERVIAEFEKQ